MEARALRNEEYLGDKRGCGGLVLKKSPLFWVSSENQCSLLLLP